MMTYDEALTIALNVAEPCKLGTETLALSMVPGRICARPIKAPLSIQPFDNSAMDGYALRHEVLQGASKDSPVTLRILATIAAGDDIAVGDDNVVGDDNAEVDAGLSLSPACCVKIMTGAPIPDGVDAVVPVEAVTLVNAEGEDANSSDHDSSDLNSDMMGARAVFTAPVRPQANIRLAGEDFRVDDPVLERGQLLHVGHVLPLATLGVGELEVFKRPRCAFVSTGKELVDDLALSLEAGQIYNSNRPYAVAALAQLGVEVVDARTVSDEPHEFESMLEEMQSKDLELIVSSGAVSVGDFDFVRETLERMGAEILYHRIGIRPGKPNLLARFSSGGLYFGLPGNPVATAVGLRFLVAPVVRKMQGRAIEQPVMARALNAFQKKPGIHFFLKAVAHVTDEGQLAVMLMAGQESFKVHPFLGLNGWVVLSDTDTDVQEGDSLLFYPAFPDEGILITE